MRTLIKLALGEEVSINGFIIRAIGNKKQPESLHIRKNGWPMLWSGLCDTVVTAPSIAVGTEPEQLPEKVTKHNAYVVNAAKPIPGQQ